MSAKTLKLRRGTTAETAVFTGASGEITIDTDKNTAVVHNDKNAGGFALAKEDLSNVNANVLLEKGLAKSDLSNVDLENLQNVARQDLNNVEEGAFLRFNFAKNDFSSSQKANQDKFGVVKFANLSEVIEGENKEKAINPKGLNDYINMFYTKNPDLKPVLPKGYIKGFLPRIVEDGNDNTLIIEPGLCVDNKNSVYIDLKESISKNISENWSVGDGKGGMPEVVDIIPKETYHLFVISKNDGTVDAGFDNAIDAKNLLNVAGDLGFVNYRRIASFVLNGAGKFHKFKAVEKGQNIEISYENRIEIFSNNGGATNASLNVFCPKDVLCSPFILALANSRSTASYAYTTVYENESSKVLRTHDMYSRTGYVSGYLETKTGRLIFTWGGEDSRVLSAYTMSYIDYRND